MKSGKFVENQDKQNRVPAKPKIEQTEASNPFSAPTTDSPLSPQAVLGMQQAMGNQAVQRTLIQRKGGAGPQEVDDTIASRIHAITNSGGGSKLSSKTEEDVSSATGVDISQANIRVHEGTEVDALNKSVGAKAFTLGNNIFMGSASKGDRDVEIHESVHAGIHQQSSSLPSSSSMTVNDPDDAFEHHADSVVEQVKSNQGDSAKSDGGTSNVQREALPEEEQVMAKRLDIQREAVEEESVQLMEEEEESLQLMEEEEESLQLMEEEEESLQLMEEEEESLQLMEEEEESLQLMEEEEESLQLMEEEEPASMQLMEEATVEEEEASP